MKNQKDNIQNLYQLHVVKPQLQQKEAPIEEILGHIFLHNKIKEKDKGMYVQIRGAFLRKISRGLVELEEQHSRDKGLREEDRELFKDMRDEEIRELRK